MVNLVLRRGDDFGKMLCVIDDKKGVNGGGNDDGNDVEG